MPGGHSDDGYTASNGVSLGLEALDMLHMSSEDGTRLLIYICEEEDRYFDCEMAPPVEGKSIGRSIGCKHPVVLHL